MRGGFYQRHAHREIESPDNFKQNIEYQQLIKVREDWIYFRERKEKRALRRSLKSNEISPKDYQAKRDRIERWVHVQKEDILKTKMVYQQEWDKTV